MLRFLSGINIQFATGDIQSFDGAAHQRIVEIEIAQNELKAMASGTAITAVHFVQVDPSAVDLADIDVQCLEARGIQPMFCRQAKQSRQCQP